MRARRAYAYHAALRIFVIPLTRGFNHNDGIFTQLRAGTAGAVQDDEHLAALRRDLDADSGHTRIPVVDYI
jgi:hypothetical protein